MRAPMASLSLSALFLAVCGCLPPIELELEPDPPGGERRDRLASPSAVLEDASPGDRPRAMVTAQPADLCAPPSTGTLTAWTDGAAWDLPLLRTDVEVAVSGVVADVRVFQTFSNPFTTPIEATYLFPLPDDAAVDGMTLRTGEREVVASVHAREEAKQIYEAARDEGRAAALLEQDRPNLFRQQVANLMPGEAIEVELHLVQPLEFEDGGYSWSFPLVVGPRYTPEEGNGATDLADARRATASPYSTTRTGHDVAIHVELDAGVPFSDLGSPSHDIELSRAGPGQAVVDLASDDRIPNKDFVLRWQVGGAQPEVALLAQADGPDSVFLLMIQPPTDASLTNANIIPKEMVFVVDTSCSMSGAPLDKAKDAMTLAIEGMNPDDRFLVMDFNDRVSQLAPGSLPNTAASRREGLAYVQAFEGSGGTRMLNGIEAALDLPTHEELLRTVVFLTDGYIGNEADILSAIDSHLGSRTRLFSLGIGSSVNRYLLDSMARAGRGDVEYVLHAEAADEAVAALYERIRNPVLTDLEVEFDGAQVTGLTPDPLPDLFAGQPLMLMGRSREPGPVTVTVRGRTRAGPYVQSLQVVLPADGDDHPGLGSLWARARVEELETLNRSGDDPGLNAELLALALDHGLMTRLTAMVAVDSEVVNPGGEQQESAVPLEVPEGVDPAVTQPPPGPPACPEQGAVHEESGGLGGLGSVGMGSGGGGYGMGSGLLGSRTGSVAGALGLGTRSAGIAAPLETVAPSAGAPPPPVAPSPQTPQARDPIVLGSLDKSLIDRIVRQQIPAVRHCYEGSLRLHPTLAGKVVVRFTIAADGTVQSVELREDGLQDPSTTACIEERFGQMVFPSPKGGGIVVVNYPLLFEPGE